MVVKGFEVEAPPKIGGDLSLSLSCSAGSLRSPEASKVVQVTWSAGEEPPGWGMELGSKASESSSLSVFLELGRRGEKVGNDRVLVV